MKSPLLMAVPCDVLTQMGPDVACAGTLVTISVDAAELIDARMALNTISLLLGEGSKLVPVTVTAVPEAPMAGVNPLIVGAFDALTVKGTALLVEPAGAVTLIVPVVAPAGTSTVSWVAVAATTVAAVLLNVTVFSVALALNPVPRMMTRVPAGPLFGAKSMIEIASAALRSIERMLPTGS